MGYLSGISTKCSRPRATVNECRSTSRRGFRRVGNRPRRSPADRNRPILRQRSSAVAAGPVSSAQFLLQLLDDCSGQSYVYHFGVGLHVSFVSRPCTCSLYSIRSTIQVAGMMPRRIFPRERRPCTSSSRTRSQPMSSTSSRTRPPI
jgi:hypothetical protein